MLGAKERAQHRAQVVVVFAQFFGEPSDCFASFFRDGWRVVDEEAIELEGNEVRALAMLKNHGDELVAIEIAAATKELLAGVVVLRSIKEVVVAAESTTSERTRAFFDIAFVVAVAFAEREEFEQLTREIFVGTSLAILVVVEVLEHRGISGD